MNSQVGLKKSLRQVILKQRQDISEDDYREKCEKITSHVIDFIENIDIESVHIFLSMKERNEVDTTEIIEFLRAANISIVVPIMNGSELTHSILSATNVISNNSYGVPEPKQKKEVKIDQFDVIFVPLLAIDEKGRRLGYGKGYYDRFLTNNKSLKLGLLFQDFVIDEVPHESHDIDLDGFITENGVRLL